MKVWAIFLLGMNIHCLYISETKWLNFFSVQKYCFIWAFARTHSISETIEVKKILCKKIAKRWISASGICDKVTRRPTSIFVNSRLKSRFGLWKYARGPFSNCKLFVSKQRWKDYAKKPSIYKLFKPYENCVNANLNSHHRKNHIRHFNLIY